LYARHRIARFVFVLLCVGLVSCAPESCEPEAELTSYNFQISTMAAFEGESLEPIPGCKVQVKRNSQIPDLPILDDVEWTGPDGKANVTILLGATDTVEFAAFNEVHSFAAAGLDSTLVHTHTFSEFSERPPVKVDLRLFYKDTNGVRLEGARVQVFEEGKSIPLQEGRTDDGGQWAATVWVSDGKNLIVSCDGIDKIVPSSDINGVTNLPALRFMKSVPVVRVVKASVRNSKHGGVPERFVSIRRAAQPGRVLYQGVTDDSGEIHLRIREMVGQNFIVKCQGLSKDRSFTVKSPQREDPIVLDEWLIIQRLEADYSVEVEFSGKDNRPKPLPGAEVTARSGGSRVKRGTTGRRGRLALDGINIPDGRTIKFSAARSDYKLRQEVELTHDQEQQSVRLRMKYEPEVTRITLKIVDAETGERMTDGTGTLTRPSGSFQRKHIEGSRPGRLVFDDVLVNHPSKFSFHRANGHMVETIWPKRDNSSTYTIRVETRGTLTLECHDANIPGKKIAGAQVYHVRGGQRDYLDEKTDDDGRVTFRHPYGMTTLYLEPPSGTRYVGAEADIVFESTQDVYKVGLIKGVPKKECTANIVRLAELSKARECDSPEVQSTLLNLVNWCPAHGYPRETPESKIALWKDAIRVLTHLQGSCPSIAERSVTLQACDMLEVGDLPNELKFDYYTYRAWAQNAYISDVNPNGAFLTDLQEELEEASAWWHFVKTTDRDYADCVYAWMLYLRGRADFLQARIKASQGTPDPRGYSNAKKYLSDCLSELSDAPNCNLPQGWIDNAKSYLVQIEAGGY
jgi:hypothetical protein